MCRIRLHLGGYPPWLLTLSRQGICCLNSVQNLQGYDLHKWLSSSPSSKIEIGVSKGLSILAFLKGYKPLGYKNSGLQWRRIKLPSAKSRRVFQLRTYLSTDEAYDPALGGYIIQVEITSNMQVSCCCKHAPWHLGANAKSFFTCLIEDPTHHIIMSRPLGATNSSYQKFKVHNP